MDSHSCGIHTKMIIFGNRRINRQVQIEEVGIERVKFLGVMINDKICLKSHIKHICTKISRSISVMAKGRHFLDNKSHSVILTLLKLLHRVVGQYI